MPFILTHFALRHNIYGKLFPVGKSNLKKHCNIFTEMKNTPYTFILYSGKKDDEKNDKRFKYLSELLIGEGKQVFIFNKNTADILGEEIKASDIKKISEIPFCVILSFFLTADEKKEIFEALPPKALIFGGKLSTEEKTICESNGHIYTDLLEDDEFSKENAIPTAEGALAVAITEAPFTLRGKNVLILGYGRVAKETSSVFYGIGMNIFCAVRKKEVFPEIEEKGYVPFLISEDGIFDPDGKFSLRDIHIIINTVPPPGRLTKELITLFCPNVLFIDLAPCSTCDLLRGSGFHAVNAPSLPGRMSPKSGAEYIYNAVCAYYAKKGEMTNE